MKATGRWLYVVFAVLFFLCVLVQFFLAGMAIFEGGQYWRSHQSLVHLFGLNVPIFMLLTAFIGHARSNDYLYIIALFVLTICMYVTANAGALHGYMGALHPVLGTVLALVSGLTVYHSITLALNKR
ncbi:DUF6220 domain-containing protein [Bacillus horti]|uniref:Membrane protein n=1 Tax=Caldalkalibacillus horti TaxID=77523 RepID=A0ABT9VZ04_9BACI|nr:DUF6220 domain-containing protein [Bacillus horti]MDQ0166224.1 putative membrane protein [Bacillus horti]